MKRKRKYNGLFNVIVKAKVTDDSRNKLEKIVAEYTNYQRYIQSYCKGHVQLYSTAKVQAQRALWGIRHPNPKEEYPVIPGMI